VRGYIFLLIIEDCREWK